MIINPTGARHYWSTNVWTPSRYEKQNGEIGKLAQLVENHIHDRSLSNPAILELCCGTGTLTRELLSMLRSLAVYNVLDSNPRSLDTLLAECNKSKVPFQDRINAINTHFGYDILPYSVNEPDIVVCSRSISHFPDLTTLFGQVYGLLKKGGAFIADTIPKSERLALLKEKYGLQAYAIEAAYFLASRLSSQGIGSELFTRVGFLRTDNKDVNEINLLLNQAGFELQHSEMDSKNHYYRFIAVKA